MKFIGYLIVALILSVPFNWLGNRIGDFLVYRSTHSTSELSFMTLGLNLLNIVLIIVVIALLLAVLGIGLYLIWVWFHWSETSNENDSFDPIHKFGIGLGWFYCLNIYVILQMLYLKYPNDELLKFFTVISNIVFGIVLIFYIIIAGIPIFCGFKTLIERMYEQPKQKRNHHFKEKHHIKM